MLWQRLISTFVLLFLAVSLSSCASKGVVLYPIQPTDFYIRDTGRVDEEGKSIEDVCMSEYYFTNVLQAKIKEK